MHYPRTAIVGAGLAGLRLAWRLADAGWPVDVFEKSRTPGGRCATRSTPAGLMDHGPSGVPDGDSALRNPVEPQAMSQTVGQRAWALQRVLAARLPPGPQALQPRLRVDSMVAAIEPEASEADQGLSAAPGEPSLWYLRMQGKAESPTATLSAGPYDRVVAAIPAEQARALLAPSAALLEALRTVKSDPCWTVMAAWPCPLPRAAQAMADRTDEERQADPLATVRPALASVPASAAPAWVLQADAAWSTAQVDAPPEAVSQQLVRALKARFERRCGVLLAAPTWTLAHRWLYAHVREPRAEMFGLDARLGLASIGDAWAGAPLLRTDGKTCKPAGIERALMSADALADAWMV